MIQNKEDLDAYEEHGSFRSLLLNYQFFKTLKITERSRVVQAFDIVTKRDVVVRFVKNSMAVHENGGHLCMPSRLSLLEWKKDGHCSTSEPCIGQSMVLSILSHRNIARQVFYKRFRSFTVTCTDYFPGTVPKGGLGEEDALCIVEQIASIADYLSSMRISVSEIKLHDILVDCKKEVMLIRLNNPSFEDQISPSIERRYINSILRILQFLMYGEQDECMQDTDRSIARSISNSKLKSIYEMLARGCTIQNLVRVCGIKHDYSFRSVLLADPTVLLQITDLGFQCTYFDSRLVNNPCKKEYYLYRLVEKSIIEFHAVNDLRISKPLEGTIRFVPEKSVLATNRLEYAECNAITHQERKKHASIKHRISVLRSMIQYPSSLRGCVTCAKLGTRSHLYLQILKSDSFFDVMRILRLMNVSSWRVKNKVRVREESMGLEIIIGLQKDGWVLLSKEHGRDVDFLHLVSELIECSKSIG